MGKFQPHTGRFKTRAELEKHVLFLARDCNCPMDDISTNTEVSYQVVCSILRRFDGSCAGGTKRHVSLDRWKQLQKED